MQLIPILALIAAVAFPLAVGFGASIFGGGSDSEWYQQLSKPPWTPPVLFFYALHLAGFTFSLHCIRNVFLRASWAFPVIWSILYVLMGVSSWLVWLHGGFKGQKVALGVYAFQLLLNFLWTPIFFGLHDVTLALVEILLLWTAIVATIYLFWHVNTSAGFLLVPYFLWVSLAISINFYILMQSNHLGNEEVFVKVSRVSSPNP